MKPERMQEELAKIDGWIRHSNKLSGAVWYEKGAVVCKFNELPPYLRSHDALQPIINGMDDDQRTAYSIELCKLMTTDEEQDYIPSADYMAEAVELLIRAIVATPEQKAEAILKALDK